MEKMTEKKRRIMIGALSLGFILTITITWYFSSQSSTISQSQSMPIAKYIQKIMANYFAINPSDHFWRHNMNELVRKGAHFAEYVVLGSMACIWVNVVFRRVWVAMITSTVFCLVYAYVDEFRQNFFSGRTPRWFDWRIDVSGAILGILIVTVVFLVVRYIQKLRKRITELESR